MLYDNVWLLKVVCSQRRYKRLMLSVQRQSVGKKILLLPLGQTAKSFLDYLAIEAGLSENTVLAYGRDLKSFLEFCKDQPAERRPRGTASGNGLAPDERISRIRQLKPSVIHDYLRSLAHNQMSEGSIKRSLAAIRMFLRFSKLTGLIEDDFTSLLESPKLWQRLPCVCSEQQVNELLNAPRPEEAFYLRDKAMLELLYACGTRASELSGMRTKDLNLDIGYLRCLGKGNRERVIPIGKIAIAVTSEYLRDLRPRLAKPLSEDFLLLSRTGRPLSRIEIWRLVKKYAVRAGMPRNLTVHTLRHCFATHLLSNGADLRSVQEMLGHVDIATTQIYTHVDQSRLRSIHKKFHPRP